MSRLKNKLTNTYLSKIDIVASYLKKITNLRDQLAAVGDKMVVNELVWICLNDFGPSWHHFILFICAHENLLVRSHEVQDI